VVMQGSRHAVNARTGMCAPDCERSRKRSETASRRQIRACTGFAAEKKSKNGFFR
jgi:hypothetical protein